MRPGRSGPRPIPFLGEALEQNRAASGLASSFERSAAKMLTAVPKVQDRTPWWASLAGRVAWAAALVALLVILWKAQAFAVIGKALGWAGALIPTPPRARQASAALDAEAIETNDPHVHREAVAVRRATDPKYDESFRQERERQKAKRNPPAAPATETTP